MRTQNTLPGIPTTLRYPARDKERKRTGRIITERRRIRTEGRRIRTEGRMIRTKGIRIKT